VVFRGSLETFCQGELGKRLARIKRAYYLDSDRTAKVFIEATMDAEQIRGRTQFPDGVQKEFSMSVQTSANQPQ
jgi:hypothetical protein